MAHHRGSLFGARGPQPSQRSFEARLALAMPGWTRPSGSGRGRKQQGRQLPLPPELWKAMVAAPRVAICAPGPRGAAYLARAYADLTEDRARLAQVVGLLRPAHPREVIEDWLAMARDGAFEALADGLMARHYDPALRKAPRARAAGQPAEVEAEDLSPAGLDALADRVPQPWRGCSPASDPPQPGLTPVQTLPQARGTLTRPGHGRGSGMRNRVWMAVLAALAPVPARPPTIVSAPGTARCPTCRWAG